MNFLASALSFEPVANPKQPHLWANVTRFMSAKQRTVNELADHFGWTSKDTWGKWKRGERRISLPSVEGLAAFFGIDVSVLDPSGERYDPDDRGAVQRRAPQATTQHEHERLQASSSNGGAATPGISTVDLVAAGQRPATGEGEMADSVLEDPKFQLVRQFYANAKDMGPDALDEFMRRVMGIRARAMNGKDRHVKKARRR